MVEIVTANLALHDMILAAVDYVERDTKALHHRRTCAAQVVRGPFAIGTASKYKCVVLLAPRQRLRAVLESTLTVAYLLADGFNTYMTVFGGRREAIPCFASFSLEALEL